MMERHWKGVARIPKVSAMKGFVKASILKRPVDEGMEFLIVTT